MPPCGLALFSGRRVEGVDVTRVAVEGRIHVSTWGSAEWLPQKEERKLSGLACEIPRLLPTHNAIAVRLLSRRSNGFTAAVPCSGPCTCDWEFFSTEIYIVLILLPLAMSDPPITHSLDPTGPSHGYPAQDRAAEKSDISDSTASHPPRSKPDPTTGGQNASQGGVSPRSSR